MIEIELPAHEDVRFLEEQWVRIAHELGPNAVQSREQLEVCAADLVWRRKRFLGLEQFSSAEHTERLGRILRLTNALLSDIRQAELYGVDFASRIIGGWTSIEDDWDDFKGDLDFQIAEFDIKWETFIDLLKALPGDCEKQISDRRQLPRLPANVDVDRNEIWVQVSAIYRETTGHDPSAHVGSPGSKNKGIAGGQFIRFIQAWMSAVPGEDEPNPEEIRWFVRRRLPELKWW